MGGSAERVLVVDAADGPELAILAGEGRAHAVIWPGMGATLRSMHRLSLRPGSRTVAQRHPGEAVYYVIEGGGEVADLDAGTSEELVEGSMAHVEPATGYELIAGERGIELVGGPSPADPALYASVGARGR